VLGATGTSRETVTGLLADWKEGQIVHGKGSILVIRDKAAQRLIPIAQVRARST